MSFVFLQISISKLTWKCKNNYSLNIYVYNTNILPILRKAFYGDTFPTLWQLIAQGLKEGHQTKYFPFQPENRGNEPPKQNIVWLCGFEEWRLNLSWTEMVHTKADWKEKKFWKSKKDWIQNLQMWFSVEPQKIHVPHSPISIYDFSIKYRVQLIHTSIFGTLFYSIWKENQIHGFGPLKERYQNL